MYHLDLDELSKICLVESKNVAFENPLNSWVDQCLRNRSRYERKRRFSNVKVLFFGNNKSEWRSHRTWCRPAIIYFILVDQHVLLFFHINLLKIDCSFNKEVLQITLNSFFVLDSDIKTIILLIWTINFYL